MKPSQYAGADWIRKALKRDLSPLGEKVANILGDVFLGIYHLNTPGLKRVEWEREQCITYILPDRELATYDGSELTRLVLLAHDYAVRLAISAAAPGNLRLVFHLRKRGADRLFERHPTLEDHVRSLREHYRREVEA